MRGYSYHALSVYDSASSTATQKETHYRVSGTSHNFDLCINGLIAKSLKANASDQKKAVRFMPDSVQYRLQWQVQTSGLSASSTFGCHNQFAFQEHCSKGTLHEARLCTEAIGAVQVMSQIRSQSMSFSSRGGVSVGADVVGNSQLQASLLWGIVKSVVASGSVFLSVRDTCAASETQKGSVPCHFSTWDAKTEADMASKHSGNVLKGGAYYDARLLNVPELPMTRARYQIKPHPRGSLSNMVVEFAREDTVQKEGFLSILVHSVGINFRDVLNVLGAYPGDPGPPGADCSGVVHSCCTSTNDGTELLVGDAVLALASGSFATTVDVPFSVVSLLSKGVSFELAASTPSVYMTVWLALKQACGASVSDTILVHAGSGGIGTAAINVSNALGANVWSTAGNVAKRGYVRSLGVQSVCSTRSTAFSAAFHSGVDLIINSLTSSGMIASSLSCVRTGGRFVELGKRDIWSTRSMKMERPDLTYNLVALDFLPPSHVRKVMTDLSHALALGTARPLASTVHGMNHVSSALRQMSRAAHIGKVIVSNESFAPILDTSSSHWVVTGGTGALGLLTGQHLTQRGIDCVLMLGRTGHIKSMSKGLCGHSCGAEVQILHCDVSCAEDCHLLGGLGVQGVMHAGGVLADSVLSNQTAQSVKQVFAPKVVGLHQLAKTFAMEAMGAQVLFSSVAALLGSAGQTNYAAANAVLDAQAHMWQNAGVSAVSVQWGPWASGGMAVKHAKRMEQMGLYMLSPYEGLFALQSIAGRVCGGGGCLDNAMWSSHAQVAVQRFMWDRFLSRMTHVPPLFSNMHDTASHGHGSSIDATRMSNTSASAASGMTLDADVLQQKVKDAVHAVVGHEVSPDDPLMAAGLDSLGAMELRSSLEQSLGIDLPGMLIFDYPSVHAIIEYAETLLGPKQVPLASAAISTGIRTVSEGSVSVHMLSLAARLPTPEHNLCQTSNAGDSIWRVPHMRWDADEDYKDGAPIVPIRFGGFLDGIELFDIPCFGVSRSEACWMDPHQRLLLEVSYECLSLVGKVYGSKTNVFLGISHAEYSNIYAGYGHKSEAHAVTSGSLSVSAGRLSFTYGLQGACAAVDTACSSSLVAAHMSYMGLVLGDVSKGLACGCEVMVMRDTFGSVQRAGMLAPDGRCKTLDASADGYVRAEACIACVLGPLEDGSKQDTVMLRGTAVNQDGRSSALTAPHGPSQQQVMRMSLHSADLDAWNVQVLQMHGTGTPLGDPIEVGAASAVLLSEATKRDFPVHMSGVKSNMGHSEAAAGMAGMVQLAGNLMHKSASAISHLRHLNHHILSMLGSGSDKNNSLAVDLSRQSSSLACGDASVGGVSGFAFQGTNAHALLSHCSGSVGNIDTVSRPGLVMLWQRERCWYVCKLPKLLSRVAFAQGGDISLEGMLNRVQHAFIWQHLFNGRPIAGMGSLIEMCAGTIDVLRSGGKNEKTDSYVMRNLTMPAPIVLDDSTSQTVNVLVQRKNEISVVCGGSSQSKTCLAGTTQWAPSTNHHSEDDVQKHTRVFDTDLSNASPSATYLGYMLPNINEMVSSEDGYVVNPVHLAMCLGLGEWSHLSGLACGADAMRMGTSSYSSAGDWLCLANRGKSSRTEMSRFGAVELNGTLHRKDLSVPLSRMRSSADLSEQVQYTLSWQSVCPVISSAQVLDDMSASSCHVWSGGDADSFVEQKSCLLDHPASLVALSLSTIAVLQDKYNQMSSCDLKLVSKSTTSTSCGVPAPFVGDQGNAMIYGILRACALSGVQSTSLHFGSHDTSNKVDESCLPLSEIHNGGGWCVYVDQSMVETAAMVPCFPHSSQSLSSVAGSWVVTGGTGALGLLTGQHLTQHGIDCVLMLGRTGHIKSMSKGLCGHSCGAEVQILHCDVSCAEDCHLLGGLGVQGVMHAGGVLADSVLGNQTAQSVKQVFAPKVVGLHQLAKTFAMEAMGAQVLFSSVAALLGSAGQTNYAAANAVLDAQAHMWQNAGVSAVSVQWGPWASGGMAAKHAKRMEQMGLYMLSPYEGLFALQSIAGRVCGGGGCLDNAMWSSHAQVAVQRFMWDRFLSRMTHVPPLFSNMHDTASHGHGSSIDATRMSNTSASAASGMTLDADVLQQKVKDAVHAVVGHEVSPDDPLMAAGLDSLGAMELRSSLEQSLGIDLPGMLIFDYPSVHAIIEYAETLLGPKQVPLASAAISTGIRTVSEGSVSVHMLSLAARLPTPEHNLCQTSNAGDSIWRVPHMRWDADEDYKDGAPIVPIRFGGFLDGIELFDIPCFGVSRSEACWMDPHQRLLLEVSYEALHSMESDSSSSWMHQKQRMGVMVGTQHVEYSNIYAGYGHKSEVHAVTSGSLSVSAGRLSFTYGLQGACAAVDTACSSSLVAAHMSYMGLVLGQLSKGLVCGVDLQISRDTFGSIQRAGMLAPDGRCKTLDASADGYVRAEACIACVLGPLEDGSKQDTVMLRGTAVNQDGRSSALTAPHGPSQQQVMRMSLHSADLDAWNVQVLQMHGTGTPLGDPIEVGAASAVLLSEATKRDFPVHMSGVKSNMGHSEAAAGMAGMVQLAGNLMHKSASAISHLRHLNHHILSMLGSGSDKNNSLAVDLSRQSSSLACGDASVGGVSGFAFQGTNAHALLSHCSGSVGNIDTVSRPGLVMLWQRERCWYTVDFDLMVSCAPARVLPNSCIFTCKMYHPAMAYLWDHVISGQALLPGAAFMELGYSSIASALRDSGLACEYSMCDSVIASPLSLEDLGENMVNSLYCTAELQLDTGGLTLSSENTGRSQKRLHVHGKVQMQQAKDKRVNGDIERTGFSREVVRSKSRTLVNGAYLYPFFAAHGLQYGPSFALLSSVWLGSNEVHQPQFDIAVGNVENVLPTEDRGFKLCPAVLDASLQVGAARGMCSVVSSAGQNDGESSTFVPAGFHALHGSGCMRDYSYHALSVYDSASSTATQKETHYRVSGTSHNFDLCINGLIAKSLKANASDQKKAVRFMPDSVQYRLQWQVQTSGLSASSTFGCHNQFAFQEHCSKGTLHEARLCTEAIGAVQVMSQIRSQSMSFSSRGGVSVGADVVGNSQLQASLLWGIVKSVVASGSVFLSVRDTCAASETQKGSVPCHFSTWDAKTEADMASKHSGNVLKGGAYYDARLLNVPELPMTRARYQIKPHPRGSLSNMVVEFAREDTVQKEGFLSILVHSVGINFRDVLNVLGAYPGDPGPPGADCSGVVHSCCTSTNDGTELLVGDAVLALASGSFATTVDVPFSVVSLLSKGVSFELAASTPSVYMTVWLALKQACGASVSDTILVHAGSGGIGTAAINVSNALGANVWSTAGNVAKRGYVRSLGVQSVCSTRSTAFSAAFHSGVDLIINSLTSSGMIASSLSCVRTGGRFVELGKRDIWSTRSMKMERPDLTYNLVALDFLPPSHVRKVMTDLSHALALGTARPLASTVHGMNHVSSALRQMSRAAHIGKVIVSNESFAPILDTSSSHWVVTGGTGALGLLTGQHLTQRGIDCVLMLGRTGHIKSMSKGLCGHSCGAEVQILHCDVSCAEDCHLLGGLGVQGVMHAGGVLADSVLSNQTAQSVKQVFAPKVVGLHQLAKTFAMEAMGAQVLFSSVAALLGSAGQTNYAAANAVLDAQAHMWQNAGVSAVSVQWGPWASGGMAVKHAKRMEQMGLYMLSPYEGLFALQSIAGRVCGGGGCLDNAMWSSHAQVAVQRFMWDRFLSRMTHVPPLFSNMHDTASHGHGSSIDATRMSNTSASAASGMTLDADVLQQKVKEAVHAVVGHEVSPDDPLMAAGLDSLGAMELRSSLEQSLGIDLPGMLIFDYPSVHAIIEYAEDCFSLNDEVVASCDEAISGSAVIDGICVSVGNLWCSRDFADVASCSDTICRVPLSRWDNDLPFLLNESFISGRFFGFLEHVECFDKDAFSLLEMEASIMDPQQRLLLSASFESLSVWKEYRRGLCGVYVGVGPNEYGSVSSPFCEQGVYTATSEAISVASGRISFTFGLQGPCMTIDTACSASLVATHLSVQGIKVGESSSSVSGGALVIVKESCQRLQKAGMLSIDGRCKTLDASADGYVRGEGCSLVCIEGSQSRSSANLLLAGSAVNQDGRSSSLTAPNGPSQQRVILKALQSAGKDKSSVALVQMHGTGTSLGDPIELSAANTAINSSDVKDLSEHSDPISFFTVKSSIGHSEVAAGVMAIAHSVTSLEMRKYLPFTHLRNLNPHIIDILKHSQGQRSPYFGMQNANISVSHAHLSDKLCGISSFAFQGTNAHVSMMIPSGDTMKGKKVNSLLRKDERCSVLPMWKRMTGSTLNDGSGSTSIQCLLNGSQLSELVYSSSPEALIVSEFATVEFTVESTNLVARSSPFFVRELVMTRSVSAHRDQLKASTLLVLDASIWTKSGLINILIGDECVSTSEIQKSFERAKKTSSKGAKRLEAGHQKAMGEVYYKRDGEGYMCHPSILHAGCSYLGQTFDPSDRNPAAAHFASCESIWIVGGSSNLVQLECYTNDDGTASLCLREDETCIGVLTGIQSPKQHNVDLQTVPISSSTRVERKALVEEISQLEVGTKEDTLQEIINIVREILQCDDIDPEETFFDAGIDSLTSLQLRATLQDKLKVQLPGTLINDYPTARSLCEMLTTSKQYKAIYLPPLYDENVEQFRQIPPCLPRWYQLLMWPSKKLFEAKDGVSFPLQDGVYRIQPLQTSNGPVRYAACSTVDINVAWTRMRSTYFFKGGIDEQKLMKSLSPVLDAFPTLTSRLVERKGDLYYEYGGSNAHVEVRTGRATQWTPQDYIGMVIPGIWKLTIAVWLWQFLYCNIGVAMFLAWRAYTSLFGSPLMRIRITHIVKERKRKSSFWSPFRRIAESDSVRQSDISGTYVTVDWMHSVADGGTMGRFMSLWAMSFRNEPLLVSHPGPLHALNPTQKELFTRLWLNESPVPRLYRPLKGVGLSYMRFLIPSAMIEQVQSRCLHTARASDVVVAYMWQKQREYTKHSERSGYPKITFLEDLRQHIPQLQPFAGNLIRFLPPLVPDVGPEEDDEGSHVPSVSDLIFDHRKKEHFTMADLERTGGLPGIPCCWSALHELINTDNSPMIMVNDLMPFDAPIRFDDQNIGIVPAEASGWRPDIPVLSEGILDCFSDIPNWQIWLTRGPDGVVVSLFSMP
ncbi:polyketide synthase [Chloropicon primus]|nr:polyketide synthase [Chloropicon primus]